MTRTMVENSSSSTPKKGSIVFLSMKDFMTFRGEVSFHPGNGFNVVLGPNGSGKSSVVSAITLGLGGEVATLRRQKGLSEFVNSSAKGDTAEIRIKLYKSADKVFDILCKINRKTNKSTFYLDGSEVTKPEVTELATKLQIQTNNLCQFLPQDVVREFPEMNPKQVFFNTIRAVGETATLDMHERLKGQQLEYEELTKVLDTRKNTHLVLEKKFEDSEEMLRNMKQFTKIADHVDLVETKVRYLEAGELRKELKDKTKEIDDLKERVRESEKKVSELRSRMKEYETEKRGITKVLQENRAILGAACTAMDSLKVEETEAAIAGLERDLKMLDDRLLKRGKKLEEEEKRVEVLEQQRDSFDVPKLQRDKDALSAKIIQLETTASLPRDEVKDLEADLRHSTNLRATLEQKRQSLGESYTRRLNLLKAVNADAYRGVGWLEGNRDEFSDGVFEPIMMSLDLKDPSYACYVEKLVGRNDLEAFVCVSADDMNRLMTSLRVDQRLKKINVVQSSDFSSLDLHYPSVPANLRDSLVSFVDDMFECPNPVRAFLRRSKQLHRIPVFADDVDATIVQRHFDKFFVGKKYFLVRTGRYSRAKSTAIEDCQHDRCHHFPSWGAARDEDVTELDSRIDDIVAEENGIRTRIAKAREFVARYEGEIAQCAREHDERRIDLGRVERLESEIVMVRSSVEQMRGLNDRDRLDETRRGKEEEIKVQALRLSADLEEIARYARESVEATVRVKLQEMKLQRLEENNSDKKAELTRCKESVEDLKNESRAANADKQSLLQRFQKVYLNLTWESPNSMKIPKNITDKLNDACDNLDTMPEVRARLASLREDLRNLPKYTEDEVKRAKSLQQRVKEGKEELVKMEREIGKKVEEANRKEKALVTKIDELVARIDSHFSDMMTRMGNAGSVQLEGAGTGDFKNYGLAIMVKFANNRGNMEKLSAGVQSGGEKSVTTALYMMALQELTKVPFRCVDEINQGMDETNERKVWNLLLETATNHSAQYFYLAPKFPRNLDFSDKMTILICHNGAAKKSKKKSYWDMKTFIQKARKMN